MSHDLFDGTHHRSLLTVTCLLAVSLVLSWFVLTGDVRLNLMDEGYLWYDTHRTAQGDVPIRDFRSYEPGRYYWGVGWVMILGEGIQALRISLAVLQFFGLFLGLLIARRVVKSNWGLVIVGILFLVWMYPRHKVFEYALEFCALFLAVRLIEEPRATRYVQAGAIVGLAAFFGRHLGLLFAAGFSCLILFLEARSGIRKTASRYGMWLAGVVVGYLPMILMLLFISNFAAGYFDFIARLIGPSTPVKAIPIPFPWRFSLSQMVSLADFEGPVLGCGLLVAVVVYLIGIVKIFSLRSMRSGSASVLTASVFLGVPLLFYFLVRADFEHFSLSVQPLLFCLLGLRSAGISCKDRRPAMAATVTLIGLAVVALVFSPEVTLTAHKVSTMVLGKGEVVKYRVLDDTVWIPKSQAEYLDLVKQLVADRIGPDQGMLIVPCEPGLYRILQKESPIWDAYPIHFTSREEEERAIGDLQSKHIQWALVSDSPLDEMPERRFSRTHPRIWQYLNENFVPLHVSWMPENQQLWRRSAAEAVSTSPEPFDARGLSEKLAALAKRRGHHDRGAWAVLRSIYEDRHKMAWIRENAERGDPVAQFHMGLAHQNGSGVIRNFQQAVEWYRKAAAQGYAIAQTSLGFMHVAGAGVAKDYAEAAKWYRKAADQGDPVAQACLGDLYEKGEGVQQDRGEAMKWYGKAAQQGYVPAQQALARLSGTGKDHAPRPAGK